MAIESIANLMADARARGYAIGYFESWNLESLQGVLDAAEHASAPVAIGFNGEFLSKPDRLARERLAIQAALCTAAAASSPVPCAMVFNECPSDSWVLSAADLGFNLVMLVGQHTSYDDYLRRVKRVVEHCRPRGVAVEAELDELPCGASGQVEGAGPMTDPNVAEKFVRDSGVDLFAISVGNVHIRTSGQQALDLDHLAELHKRIKVPLVLHGGSGIPGDSIQAAIRLGVAKVNYGTYLKQRYLTKLRQAAAWEETNPHELLGLGGNRDIMVATRLAVRDAVLERIEDLRCEGKAQNWPRMSIAAGRKDKLP
ncbi:MAG TPA: class II fructose-bisphosphate aldolase [Lacunisphaera sp.]|nr:class II fructose-bisphosphate aldolase [Lacunisphaera sp.]